MFLIGLIIFVQEHLSVCTRGLGVTCSPRNTGVKGSNPTEHDGVLYGSKYPEHKSSGRNLKK